MSPSPPSSPASAGEQTGATPHPEIATFVLSEFETNCFLVTVPGHAECWIVDCGLGPEAMFETVADRGLRPTALLLTHAHPDHMAGVDAARAKYGALPVYLHEAERGFCSDATLNLSALMGMPVTCGEPDHWLQGGEILELHGSRWRVVHAPGHSPGGVLFVHDDSRQAIVGDTLFAGSIGRIDFPTSDPEAMRRTLFDVIMKLPDDMTIFPGHGPATTIAAERRSNPFILGGL